MAMNRLRNVAVRIRPIATPKNDDAEAAKSVAPGTKAPQPRRVASGAAPTSSKPQIWDLEEDAGAEEARSTPVADRPLVDAPATRPGADPPIKDDTLAPPPPALPLVSSPGSGRSKTRILGFHASDLTTDVFDDPKPVDSGPQFPAGFLVVTQGPGRGAFFAVTASVRSIGRGSDQDIALDFGDESISREGHASVMFDEESSRFFLGHGNKANVVRRNGAPVLATEEMAHGDLIRVGKTTLRFHAFCDGDFAWSDTDDDRQTAGEPAQRGQYE